MPDRMEDASLIMQLPYFQSPNDIFDLELPLTIYQKITYIYLCRCCNQGATAFPSYNTIAKKCGMSRRKAIDTINELIKVNLLKKEVRPKDNNQNLTNVYRVNIPSAYSAPTQCTTNTTIVHDVHYPSEQDAPKKELYKNKKNKKNHETKAGNTNNKSKGNFNNFPQRQYDFNKLEKGLLGIENVNIDDIQEV